MEKNLEEKLGRLAPGEMRLVQFNGVLHKVLRDNAKNSDYELISEDGVVNIENLKRITDRIGTGSIRLFYRNREKNPLTKREITGGASESLQRTCCCASRSGWSWTRTR
jgi:hypothetical protein